MVIFVNIPPPHKKTDPLSDIEFHNLRRNYYGHNNNAFS